MLDEFIEVDINLDIGTDIIPIKITEYVSHNGSGYRGIDTIEKYRGNTFKVNTFLRMLLPLKDRYISGILFNSYTTKYLAKRLYDVFYDNLFYHRGAYIDCYKREYDFIYTINVHYNHNSNVNKLNFDIKKEINRNVLIVSSDIRYKGLRMKQPSDEFVSYNKNRYVIADGVGWNAGQLYSNYNRSRYYYMLDGVVEQFDGKSIDACFADGSRKLIKNYSLYRMLLDVHHAFHIEYKEERDYDVSKLMTVGNKAIDHFYVKSIKEEEEDIEKILSLMKSYNRKYKTTNKEMFPYFSFIPIDMEDYDAIVKNELSYLYGNNIHIVSRTIDGTTKDYVFITNIVTTNYNMGDLWVRLNRIK